MDDKYNSYFFNQFYEENGGGNYTKRENWTGFFSSVADKIIEIFAPKTVLDAGCAMGYLVEALRNRGVEAYGFDISDYAVANASDSIKPYLAVHSITEKLPENFPNRFDLIVTIEVMEHLFPEDSEKAVRNLCSYSDTIIFTSTPDDIEDRTHCNVRLPEHWCRLFAKNSFYHDLLQPMDFICPWALLFRKREKTEDIIFEYELSRRIDRIDNAKNLVKNNIAAFYFDTGNGFGESNCIQVPYEEGEGYTFDINIPKDCRAVRFDPVENRYALVRIISAAADTGFVQFSSWNGRDMKGYVFFDNTDPQFIAEIKGGARLRLNADIYTFESIDVLRMFMEAYKSYNDRALKIEKLNADMLRSNEENQRQMELLRRESQKQLNMLKTENEKQISEVRKEKKNIERQLREVTEINNAIVNSTCWKLTKPVRRVIDFLRLGGIKKKAVMIYKKNTPYSIDKSIYEDSIYSLKGWIFSTNSTIEDIRLIIKTDEKEYTVEEGLFGIKRNDVYKAYNNENALKSGFEFSVLVNVNGSFRTFLEYSKNGSASRIDCGSFRSDKGSSEEDSVLSIINTDVPSELDKILDKYLLRKDIDYSPVYERSYDIIIPVYNGYKYLDKLFSSVAKTKANYNLIVINDAGDDERVEEFLKKYEESHNNVTFISHSENRGFVKTVNEGLKRAVNDVVILNTDVELPEQWLERLMLPIVTDGKVASVTPFTNSGTICSFPIFLEDNEIFMGRSVDEVDSAFRRIKPQYVQAPTGVGFCMGMSKKAIDETGLLDEETFAKGYGEENDWCQRAIKKGYKNVIAENLFVYHNHGGSFVSEEKKALIERNSKLLLKKHPDYNRDVALYCAQDPHKELRKLVIMLLGSELSSCSYMVFNHSLGGGADAYIKNCRREIIAEGSAFTEISYDISRGLYNIGFSLDTCNISYSLKKLDYILILKTDDIIKTDTVIINELISYPELYNVMDIIKEYCSGGRRLVYLLHDYFALCPSCNLLNDEYRYCFCETDESICNRCLKNNNCLSYEEYGSMEKWRKNWENLLSACDEVRAFSEDSVRLVKKIYPSLDNITLVPHRVEYLPVIEKSRKTTDTLNIGLIGVLCRHKGIEIIEELLGKITGRNIRIVLIGYSDKEIRDKNFRQTGKYTYDELPRLTLENDIDVFFISSICPETFSYTTEEAIKMGYPVMCFDIGAPAERVKRYAKGYIIPEISSDAVLGTIEKISLLPRAEKKKILFITEYISFSSRYRVEHFMEQLLLNNVLSDFITAEDIKSVRLQDYNAAVIYRSKYTDELGRFIDKAHSMDKKVFFDTDDLVFDYDRIKHMDFLKDNEYSDFREYTERIYQCMERCDGFITSTEALSREIKRVFPHKPVCVNRNVLSLEMLTISNKAKETAVRKKNKVTLGYFSGSKTHNKDFELIQDILLKIMEEMPEVCLKIGGVLDIDKGFDAFKKRVERFDFCDWKTLPELIGSVDINLMPLEQSIFHECKSENKWTEAAAVGVCTVGSYNDELAINIKNGENGFLCRNAEEWYFTLKRLIEDKILREQIAENANIYIKEHCTVLTVSRASIDFVLSQEEKQYE